MGLANALRSLELAVSPTVGASGASSVSLGRVLTKRSCGDQSEADLELERDGLHFTNAVGDYAIRGFRANISLDCETLR